jgi:hypothetical protein
VVESTVTDTTCKDPIKTKAAKHAGNDFAMYYVIEADVNQGVTGWRSHLQDHAIKAQHGVTTTAQHSQHSTLSSLPALLPAPQSVVCRSASDFQAGTSTRDGFVHSSLGDAVDYAFGGCIVWNLTTRHTPHTHSLTHTLGMVTSGCLSKVVNITLSTPGLANNTLYMVDSWYARARYEVL